MGMRHSKRDESLSPAIPMKRSVTTTKCKNSNIETNHVQSNENEIYRLDLRKPCDAISERRRCCHAGMMTAV